jgi:hypothetical protein
MTRQRTAPKTFMFLSVLLACSIRAGAQRTRDNNFAGAGLTLLNGERSKLVEQLKLDSSSASKTTQLELSDEGDFWERHLGSSSMFPQRSKSGKSKSSKSKKSSKRSKGRSRHSRGRTLNNISENANEVEFWERQLGSSSKSAKASFMP